MENPPFEAQDSAGDTYSVCKKNTTNRSKPNPDDSFHFFLSSFSSLLFLFDDSILDVPLVNLMLISLAGYDLLNFSDFLLWHMLGLK